MGYVLDAISQAQRCRLREEEEEEEKKKSRNNNCLPIFSFWTIVTTLPGITRSCPMLESGKLHPSEYILYVRRKVYQVTLLASQNPHTHLLPLKLRHKIRPNRYI
jgi:hypothetical protein